MAVIEYMNVVLGLDHKNFDQKIEHTTKKLHSFSVNVGGLGKAMAGIGAGIGFAGLAKASIQLAADAEQSTVAFEVLTGSAEKAQRLVRDFRKLDQESPLAFTDFQQAAKTLIGFGVETGDVTKRLEQLSAISMGNAERFQTLSLAFSQTSAAGRLMGQEVLQFVNSGFNPLQQISKMTGESMADLKKRMEEGKISVSEVGRAFDAAVAKGGMFYQMNERIAKTTAGQLAKLQGDFKLMGIELGNELIPVLKDSIDLIREFSSDDGALVGVTRGLADGFGLLAGSLKLIATGDFSGLDALTDRIMERDANLKAQSFVHKMTEDEKERFDKRMKQLDEEKRMQEEVRSIIEQGIADDWKAQELSSKKIEELQKEIELQKQKNLGVHDEIKMKADAIGYSQKEREEMRKLMQELEELKSEPAQKARAKALVEEVSPFESMMVKAEEAARLMGKGFLDQIQYSHILNKIVAESVNNDLPDRRDTPTAMAGSVEAYKIFLERDQDRAKEREIAFRSEQTLKGIHQELKNRGVLGVAKR